VPSIVDGLGKLRISQRETRTFDPKPWSDCSGSTARNLAAPVVVAGNRRESGLRWRWTRKLESIRSLD
jgi:hypothetical protein